MRVSQMLRPLGKVGAGLRRRSVGRALLDSPDPRRPWGRSDLSRTIAERRFYALLCTRAGGRVRSGSCASATPSRVPPWHRRERRWRVRRRRRRTSSTRTSPSSVDVEGDPSEPHSLTRTACAISQLRSSRAKPTISRTPESRASRGPRERQQGGVVALVRAGLTTSSRASLSPLPQRRRSKVRFLLARSPPWMPLLHNAK